MARGEKGVRQDSLSSTYIVTPVTKAMRVLEFVAQSGRDVSLTEVASSLGFPKTSTFRYLRTLSAERFLYHDIYADRYGIGSRFRYLARVDGAFERLRMAAVPLMCDLSRVFGETLNLAVYMNTQMTYVEIIRAARAPRMDAQVGRRHPMHSTALGKAILANLHEDERAAVLARALPARTFRTVTDAFVLDRQLHDVRSRGFAVEVGENEDELMCVGAPILDSCASPLAALSLSAPERRMTAKRLDAAARALCDIVTVVSRALPSDMSAVVLADRGRT